MAIWMCSGARPSRGPKKPTVALGAWVADSCAQECVAILGGGVSGQIWRDVGGDWDLGRGAYQVKEPSRVGNCANGSYCGPVNHKKVGLIYFEKGGVLRKWAPKDRLIWPKWEPNERLLLGSFRGLLDLPGYLGISKISKSTGESLAPPSDTPKKRLLVIPSGKLT